MSISTGRWKIALFLLHNVLVFLGVLQGGKLKLLECIGKAAKQLNDVGKYLMILAIFLTNIVTAIYNSHVFGQ